MLERALRELCVCLPVPAWCPSDVAPDDKYADRVQATGFDFVHRMTKRAATVTVVLKPGPGNEIMLGIETSDSSLVVVRNDALAKEYFNG